MRGCWQVDAMWRELMEAALSSPGVLGLAGAPARLEALNDSNRLLEEIQKGLAVSWESC